MRKIKNRRLSKLLPMMLAMTGLLSAPVFAAPSNNQVTVDSDQEIVYGGGDEQTTARAANNAVEINDGDVGAAIGGVSSEGEVTENEVVINGGDITGATGGLSVVNHETLNTAGNVTGNRIIIHGGTIQFVSGGEVGYTFYTGDAETFDTSLGRALVSNNSVEIDGGTINGAVVGGAALTGSAINNSVKITGGTVSGPIIAGMVRNPLDDSYAVNNTLTIALKDKERPNDIPDLSNADLIGGVFLNTDGSYNFSSDRISGNTLHVDRIAGLNVRSVQGFDTMNFKLPYGNGDPMLNITGGSATELNGTTINVSADGRAKNIQTGNSFNLIQNASGITGSNVKLPNVLQKGVSFKYKLELLDDDGNVIAYNNGDDLASSAAIDSDGNFSTTGFHARVGEQIGGIDKKTERIINPTPIPTFRELGKIVPDNNKRWKSEDTEFREIQDEDYEISNEMRIFAGVSGSSIRTKLSDGGHINSKTVGFGVGGTKTIVNKSSRSHFSFAPIIDYGHGKFDTFTGDDEHGEGDTHFAAGGLIARKMNRNGFYYEGSFRYGRAQANFSSNDFPELDGSTYASYNLSAPVMAGHVNIGKVFAVNRENTVHVYGQYYHSYQGSMAADLSSGEHYNFDSINGGTFLTGIRFIRRPNRLNKFYSGFAYQYEHGGESSATYDGQSTKEVDSNGSSGMIELGWELKPHERVPWVVDLSAVGWIGQQKGLTFHAKVKKSF